MRGALIAGVVLLLFAGYRFYWAHTFLQRSVQSGAVVQTVSRRTLWVTISQRDQRQTIPVRRPFFSLPGSFTAGDSIDIWYDPREDYEASGFPFAFRPSPEGRVASLFQLYAGPCIAAVFGLICLTGSILTRTRPDRFHFDVRFRSR